MLQRLSGWALVSLLAGAGAAGCKNNAPSAPPPVPPSVETSAGSQAAPTTAPPPGAGAALSDAGTAGAADPELAIITITVVDIDTQLAVMCGVPESQVFFKFDSARLLPGAKERLQQIATCATTGPAKGRNLVIVGRADPVGSDEYNKQLGVSRAEAVAKYLQEQGVKQARTEIASKGEAAAPPAPWHWPLERRVTIRLQP